MEPSVRINIESHQPGRPPGAGDIVHAIKTQYENRLLPSGCRLPPVRALALQLGISKNTVASAYDELVAQNVILNRRRCGYFVREDDKFPPTTFSCPKPPLPELETPQNVELCTKS